MPSAPSGPPARVGSGTVPKYVVNLGRASEVLLAILRSHDGVVSARDRKRSVSCVHCARFRRAPRIQALRGQRIRCWSCQLAEHTYSRPGHQAQRMRGSTRRVRHSSISARRFAVRRSALNRQCDGDTRQVIGAEQVSSNNTRASRSVNPLTRSSRTSRGCRNRSAGTSARYPFRREFCLSAHR